MFAQTLSSCSPSSSLAPFTIDNSKQHHSQFLLNGLQILKTSNILCDIVLIAQEKRFEAHKIVLASVSDYFRSMFTSGMKECSQKDIELKGVSSNGLEKFIEIIYTSRTHFNSNTDLFDVISCANHLQCLLVLDYCDKNLLNRLTCKNFNYFIKMSKMYRMQNSLKQIELFILNNLAQIIQNQTQSNNQKRLKIENFDDCEQNSCENELNYLTFKQLLRCLKNENLRLKEIDLFSLTWQWINDILLNNKFKFKKTKKQLVSIAEVRPKFNRKIDKIRALMKQIRFALISPNDLVNKVQNCNKLMLNDKFLRNLVLNSLNHHVLASNKQSSLLNLKIRSPVNSILIIGGREINPQPSLHDTCFLLNDIFPDQRIKQSSKSIRKQPLTTLPNNLSHMQCVLVENNFLYIIGGCLSQCAHGESAVSTTFRYDPRFNKWTNSCSMLEKRAYFYACALNDENSKQSIFSFGGKNKDGSLSSVEKYDIDTNTWTFVNQLPSTYYAHTGAVINNIAYTSGGYTQGHFTPDLHSFNPITDEWEELRPMNTARGWHSMCVAKERLYVFGGCYLIGSQAQSGPQIAHPVVSTEYYSPLTDQWTLVRPMSNLHKEASCFKVNNYIYIFGGYNISAKTGQKLISKYDVNADTWHTIGQLPSGMTGVGCCLLDLPWHVVEQEVKYNFDFDHRSNLDSSSTRIEFNNKVEKKYCNYEVEAEIEDDEDDMTTSYSSCSLSQTDGEDEDDYDDFNENGDENNVKLKVELNC